MLKRFVTIGALVALPLAAGCSRGDATGGPDQSANPVATDSRPGDQQPGPGGQKSTDPTAARPGETRNPISKMVDGTPEYREITLPAGTVLPVELQTTVSSETSHPEERVRARVRQAVTVDGYEAVPVGSTLGGVVTEVRQSGRVKGRAHVALRFSSLEAHDEQTNIRTDVIARTAPATKKADATKIGIGAGAGAVVGGIVGGGSGAAKGAAIGGAGGTGYVLATRGKPVSLPSGTALKVTLLEPITVRVPVKR
jgi:hypothetical protein